ncbi:neurogenic locus notch homolog protein 1-like isoform X1 [Branchiostoma floridae]|uniref:Neurogenic locus notch homolog protein 1-like isoform X1 n=1 Tax=Branchiostoma floridae TaxID=7739 RepID=A0A9J7MP74_BRAFL|nr:neurogenic locus notch homolog protein 1-like isoform X1 [Branchiostoma floridae]
MMWKLFIFVAVLSTWPTSSQGEKEYLDSVDGWDFFKVPATGPMTNANVKATCESEGLWHPCYYTGQGTCNGVWASECIKYDGSTSGSCRTLSVLSNVLCGTADPHLCKDLDDTFVYQPGSQSAYGVDYDTGHWGMEGANHTDKYALCAGQHEYVTSWDGLTFYKVRVNGAMTNANVKTTCELAGMGHTCWYTGLGTCTSSSYWSSDCVSFSQPGTSCQWTLSFFSFQLCGTTTAYRCDALINTYVKYPIGSYDSAYGVVANNYDPAGYHVNDQYALCAARQCEISPCVHGTCEHGVKNYTCLCDAGWSGVHCDTLIDSCDSNPCLSGGTCVDEEDGYSCTCPPQTTGNNCETVHYTDKCYWISDDRLPNEEASMACGNMEGNLAKVNEPADHQVLASYLDDGRNVSFWTSNKISPMSMCACSDGSPLSAIGASSWMYSAASLDMCVLLDSDLGYTGTYQPCAEEHNYVCQSEALTCNINECQNGGNCSSCFGDTTVFCDCPQGFTGTFCEMTDWCDPNPCPLDWKCVSEDGGIHCAVPTEMRAVRSSFCTASSCGPGWTCEEEGSAGYSCTRG